VVFLQPLANDPLSTNVVAGVLGYSSKSRRPISAPSHTAGIVFVIIKSKFPGMNTTPITLNLNLTGQLTIDPQTLEQLISGLQIQAPVQNPSTAQFGNGHEPRIYSREETAKMLGNKTPRYVDLLCRRGLLQKFTPKGNCRAIGVYSESLMAFIAQQRC
jgi:hypothetical protein